MTSADRNEDSARRRKKRVASGAPDPDFHITSGTFRKLCSTTRDTLRYYREQGILVPHINAGNGYSYYSHAQIGSFYLIRSLQSMGCSIADIRAYLLSGDQDTYNSYVTRQYDALLEERRQLDLRIEAMRNTISVLDLARSIDGRGPQNVRLAQEPRILSTPVTAADASSLQGISPDLNTHLAKFDDRRMQAFPLGVVMNRALFKQGTYRYEQIFSAEGCLFHPDENGPIAISALVSKDTDGPIEDRYREFAASLDGAQGDVHCLSIVNTIDPSQDHNYVKLMFALQDAN